MKKLLKGSLSLILCLLLLVSCIGMAALAAETYTVTFTGPGIEIPDQTVEAGQAVTKPDDPELPSREFGGWFKDEACTEAWDFDTDTVTADTTLYAKWIFNLLKVEFTGDGTVVAAPEGEELVYPDDDSSSSFYTTLRGTYTIGARAGEGYEFVRWETEDGTVYSTDAETTVTLAEEDISLVAVFEDPSVTAGETFSLILQNGMKGDLYSGEAFGVFYTLERAGLLQAGDAIEGFEFIRIYNNADGQMVFMYDTEGGRFGYGPAWGDIVYEISDEVRQGLYEDLEEYDGYYSEEMLAAIRDVADNGKTVQLVFAPLNVLIINTNGDGNIAYSWDGIELSEEHDTNFNTSYVGTYVIRAVPGEQAVFTKWTLNGEDYSTDPEITVELDGEDLELTAYFEYQETGDVTVLNVPGNVGGAYIVKTDDSLVGLIPKTHADEAALDSGKDIYLILEMDDITDSVSNRDKGAALQSRLSGTKIAAYLDLRLLKQVEDQEAVAVRETWAPLKISFTIPEQLQSEGRVFYLIRVHEGIGTVIMPQQIEDALIFETDQFSTYALAYWDDAHEATVTTVTVNPDPSAKPENTDKPAGDAGEKPEDTQKPGVKSPYTGDSSPLYAAAALCAGLLTAAGCAVIGRKKKQ